MSDDVNLDNPAEGTQTDVDTQNVDTQNTGRDNQSLLTDDGEGAQAPADWPEDWRDKFAGEDKKFRKQLDRVGSPTDFAKNYRELEKLKANIKKPFPEGGSEEEVSAWRKDNGIPDKAEGYDITLPDGMLIGDDLKPMVDVFLNDMHAQNASNETVKNVLSSYMKIIEDEKAAYVAADKEHYEQTVSSMRQEWGPEYKGNISILNNWLNNNGDFAKSMFEARDPSGRKMINNPDFARFILNHVMATDPAEAVSGASGTKAMDRLAELRTMLRENPQKYYSDNKYSEELAKLADIEERIKNK